MLGTRRRIVLAAPLAALALGAWPATASPVPSVDDRIIPAGIQMAGVDLSGLSIDAAAGRLDQTVGVELRKPITVRVGDHDFRLTAEAAKQSFDARQNAERALALGRQGQRDIPMEVSHDRDAVRRFARRVSRATGKPARDAQVKITVRRMVRRPARAGFAVDPRKLSRRLHRVLDRLSAPRDLKAVRERVEPEVSGRDLRRQYETVVTIDRGHFRLRLFKGFRRVKAYGIAVGQAGLETPTGLFSIAEKQIDPAWHVPNRPWAGDLAGQTIPGGAPNNPLKARWLGITDGVGIHGTSEEWSIGSQASHGCIRMRVPHVIALYRRVPVGTPVLIR